MPMYKCPRCGLEQLKPYERPLALPTLALHKETGQWVIEEGVSFGVTARYCIACKYVEFEHITPDGLDTFLQDRVRSILE